MNIKYTQVTNRYIRPAGTGRATPVLDLCSLLYKNVDPLRGYAFAVGTFHA